jgi:lipopolysaccharide export system protein LptC
MSRLADAERNKRRLWAAVGGSHDRLVRALQIGLPLAVGALVAVLLFAPFGHRGEISFLLAKNKIEVTDQRIEVKEARYRGTDSMGRPFSLSAESALQRSSADPVVRMRGLVGDIAMADGPAQLTATAGRYDPTRETVMVDGRMAFTAADGYRLETGNVAINLTTRRLTSGLPVTGSLPIGSFSADRISADLVDRTVRLSGNARLRINQGVVR